MALYVYWENINYFLLRILFTWTEQNKLIRMMDTCVNNTKKIEIKIFGPGVGKKDGIKKQKFTQDVLDVIGNSFIGSSCTLRLC